MSEPPWRNAAVRNSFIWAGRAATQPRQTVFSEPPMTQPHHDEQFYLRRPWRNAAVRNNFIWAGRGAMQPWDTVLSEAAVTMSHEHPPTCPAVLSLSLPFPFPYHCPFLFPFTIPFPPFHFDFTCFTSLTSPSLPSPSLPSLPGMGRGRSSVEPLENWWVDGPQARHFPWYLKKCFFWKPNPAFKFHFMIHFMIHFMVLNVESNWKS